MSLTTIRAAVTNKYYSLYLAIAGVSSCPAKALPTVADAIFAFHNLYPKSKIVCHEGVITDADVSSFSASEAIVGDAGEVSISSVSLWR